MSKPESVPDMEKGPDADDTIPMKTIMNKVNEFTIINNKKPLWLRSPKECTTQEYNEFYKQTFNVYDDPSTYTHFSVEGNVMIYTYIYSYSHIVLYIIYILIYYTYSYIAHIQLRTHINIYINILIYYAYTYIHILIYNIYVL